MLNERHFKKALKLHEQGAHAEAGAIYDELLKANPGHPHILHTKGLLQAHMNDFPAAVALLKRAIVAAPANAAFYASLGGVLEAMGNRDEAAIVYSDQATALLGSGKYVEASEAADKSLSVKPTAAAETVKAMAIRQSGEEKQAADYNRKTISRLKGKARTLADFVGLGDAYMALGDYPNARRTADACVRAFPASAVAHHNLAILQLLAGDFAGGFSRYEERWKPDSSYMDRARAGFSQPVWQGETPVELGGPLLVVAEQAMGDTIQFARYAALLADQGHDVLFEVHSRILSLFREGFDRPNLRTIPRQYNRLERFGLGHLGRKLKLREHRAPLTGVYGDLPFKAWVGSMSLPHRFGTTLENMPGTTPYLKANPAKVERWRKFLGPSQGGLRVGLVWSGEPTHPDDYKRSIPAEKLTALLETPGIIFYSLQKGSPATYEFPPGLITRLGDRLTDFTETAAAMECLDLIISVDTAPVHLAGALGRPTWLLLPKIKDWRWLMEGETTGWYPSVRIFRQAVQGEWGEVLERTRAALEEKVEVSFSGSHAPEEPQL